MNTKGHPRTLVPAHPGNTNAVRYGVYSNRMIEPRAAEIEEELLTRFEFTVTQRIAVHEVARCMAILEAVDHDLDERGLVDRKGEARTLLDHRARISRRLDDWLTKISPTIDRQTARAHAQRAFREDDYIRELKRIALGDDSASTTHDRLTAMKKLYELERSKAWQAYRSGLRNSSHA
jgi:hypothetical protein